MSEDYCPVDAFRSRLSGLNQDDLRALEADLLARLDFAATAYANTCVHCGLCADSCHYFLTDSEYQSVPAYKLNLVARVIRRRKGNGSEPSDILDRQTVDEWIDCLFGRCSLCNRCGINCSTGINISQLIRLGRSALASAKLVPPELQATVDTAVNTGNNMGITKAEWLDTVEWLTEELRTETGDPTATIPLDKQGANVLYALNPREVKFFPLSLLATAKIFHLAGESWTFSQDYYDVTNYALFSGDDEVGGVLSERLYATALKLGCRILVLGECGHGFNSSRWEAPQWLAKRPEMKVISVLELVKNYIEEGRIKLDRNHVTKRVTVHDPCNLVRLGGIIEEQRVILRQAVSDFVEMTPNRAQNFCCGGGGGQLSMTRYAKRRLAVGKIKAEQIKKTGAKIVATPCHNCVDQLSELNREYKLGVEIKTVCEIVADAIVIGDSPTIK